MSAMPADEATSLRGIEMSEQEIGEFLHAQGHGVLSLARGGDSYAIPVSFGYDGEDIYLSLIEFGDESRKLDFVEETDQACLVTYRVETRHVWKSAIALGRLEEVPADEYERAEEVLKDNAWFPSIFPPTQPITGFHRMILHIDEATGRKGEGYQLDDV